MLILQRLITREQRDAALLKQSVSGHKIGRILVDAGLVSEEQIASALARQMSIPFVDITRQTLDPALVQLLPEAQARRFRALVLGEEKGALRIGMAYPSDMFAYDELTRVLKRELVPVVVTETQVLAAIDRVYRHAGEIASLSKELTAELTRGRSDIDPTLASDAALRDAPIVKLLQKLFEDAVGVRASDIHIEPQEHKLRVRFRIDGSLHLQTEMDSKIALAVVLRLKLMSGLDISDKRLPQDGRFHVDIRGNALDVRISTLPTQYGESVVMRLLNQASGHMKLDRLGLPSLLAARLSAALQRASGMILVTGPTGSGKTTTLYAALNEINSLQRKIITVEDPVEYRIAGINQVQVHAKIDLSFERVLRAALRQDPDVILVGEMRDSATVEIGLRAAMTGHLVLSTLHTNDAASTPVRLLDMGVPAFMVAMSLNLVIAQRLVRRICSDCAEPHTATAGEQAWLAARLRAEVPAAASISDIVAAKGRFRHGVGCEHCNRTGFVGRTAVYEALEMTPPLVAAANRGTPTEFIDLARAQIGAETLVRHALGLAWSGQSTLADAIALSAQSDGLLA